MTLRLHPAVAECVRRAHLRAGPIVRAIARGAAAKSPPLGFDHAWRPVQDGVGFSQRETSATARRAPHPIHGSLPERLSRRRRHATGKPCDAVHHTLRKEEPDVLPPLPAEPLARHRVPGEPGAMAPRHGRTWLRGTVSGCCAHRLDVPPSLERRPHDVPTGISWRP